MFRKILFPIDLSELSRKGLTWTAVNVADPSSEIILVHVVEPLSDLDISPIIADAEAAMGNMATELSAIGIRNRALVLSGDPLETLSEIAHSEGCSISVYFAESNDVVVPFIRYMAIPHLVVKTSEERMPPQEPFRHIAVCSDLSPDRTDRMLVELKLLLGGRGVPMTILHSVSLDDAPSSSEMFQAASSALEEVRESVASWNPEVQAEILTGEPEVEILRRAAELQPGILVVGLSTHGNLWELIIGSTGEAIIERATCPVLVIPA
ncbi:MAG: universal stress protein [Thermovirgaceae bacterium]|nr:universal stress protein [Thermovirgaceae bacterium]